MQTYLPQVELLEDKEVIVSKHKNTEDIIKEIKSYISNEDCENLKVDISSVNIIDSCKIINLCASQHFIKYPNGIIEWKISSNLIKTFNKSMELGNNRYLI